MPDPTPHILAGLAPAALAELADLLTSHVEAHEAVYEAERADICGESHCDDVRGAAVYREQRIRALTAWTRARQAEVRR